MKAKQLGWFAVSTGIIATMIYLADISKFITYVEAADRMVLAAAISVGLLPIPIWANSWYNLINRVGGDVGFPRALKLFTAGNFLNAITPLGQFGGEPLMAYVIQKNTDLAYEDALSAVISADIINAVPIFTFITAGSIFLLFSGSMSSLIAEVALITLMIILLGGTFVYLLWFRSGFIEERLVRFLRRLTGRIGRGSSYVDEIEKRMDGLQEAFRTVGADPALLLKVTAIAHLFFVFNVFSMYLVMLSVGVKTDLTPLYFVLPAASLANFSPTPGGSGTYEAVMAGILNTFLGLGGTISVTIAILYRFTTFWPSILLGYVSFTSLSRFDSQEFRNSASEEDPQDQK